MVSAWRSPSSGATTRRAWLTRARASGRAQRPITAQSRARSAPSAPRTRRSARGRPSTSHAPHPERRAGAQGLRPHRAHERRRRPDGQRHGAAAGAYPPGPRLRGEVGSRSLARQTSGRCTRPPRPPPVEPMHDLKFLRQHRDKVEAGIALKGVQLDLSRFYQIEERRLALLHETEQLKAKRNAASEDIARLKKSGGDAAGPIAQMRALGDRVKDLDQELRQLQEAATNLAAWIPNLPHPSVPPGSD